MFSACDGNGYFMVISKFESSKRQKKAADGSADIAVITLETGGSIREADIAYDVTADNYLGKYCMTHQTQSLTHKLTHSHTH